MSNVATIPMAACGAPPGPGTKQVAMYDPGFNANLAYSVVPGAIEEMPPANVKGGGPEGAA